MPVCGSNLLGGLRSTLRTNVVVTPEIAAAPPAKG
jgi:hypothetical protein